MTMDCPLDFYECLKCKHLADYSKVPTDEPILCEKCGERLAEPEGG